MGDMAEPWKSMRAERQMQVARGERVSMQYRTKRDREQGVAFKADCQRDFDKWTSEKLTKLGITHERKGASSFQINLNGRIGMYYDGKKGEQIRWNDGEVVKLPYIDSLEDYIKDTPHINHKKED